MGMNVVEKILSEHLISGELVAGEEIAIKIDQALTQDATGTMAYLQFESMGIEKVKCELAVSYIDHNTVQVGFENADDHAYLRSAAARYGAVFSPPGNGICHQVHLERFGAPGKTLLGSDSHTPTGGGLGMIAMGAGGIDVAVAMGGGAFYLTSPKVIKIELTGELRPWASAKDVILKVLEQFGTKGNVGCIMEYGGDGLKHLEVPERATITNMGAELGVTTSVFPSDEITKKFLAAQDRADVWCEIVADDDAEYDQVVKIDLAEVVPMAAAPHSPGNVVSITSLAGKKVNQVLIGSCTNSSYVDLKTVAKLLKGKVVHPDVSFGIAPGSRQVLNMLAEEGYLSDLLSSGARLLESACGFCIGNSQSPGTNAVSLRTSNRNFEGRSGTPSADVYLVSPSTAALAALHGCFIDPEGVADIKFPKVKMPKTFKVDDSHFIGLAGEPNGEVEVVRGPNIGVVPAGEECAVALNGVVSIKVGDKITTDHIMPAGARLKYRSNIAKYSEFVFEGVDAEFHIRAAASRDQGVANLIVAGESYGQGSSREHAALCPMFLGVKVVIAKSIERIHMANLINFGIVPFMFSDQTDYDKVEEGDVLSIVDFRDVVKGSDTALLRNETKSIDITLDLSISDRQREILLAGGLLKYNG
ncbi:MAG: aconitate hydratase [Kiritimatiellae bacterium]|nr:aconitate hydratase [Kiritimatiellia bacterium]